MPASTMNNNIVAGGTTINCGEGISSKAHEFFQTDTSIEKQLQTAQKESQVAKLYGEPAFRASSQILCMVPASADSLFITESAFIFKRVSFSTLSSLSTASTAAAASDISDVNSKRISKVGNNIGNVIQSYKGHKGPVTSCVFGAIGSDDLDQFLFSGSWDKTVKRWNAKTGECLATFEGHMDFVKSLALQVYDMETIDPLTAKELLGSNSTELLSSSSSLLILLFSGSSDRTIRVWNAQTGQCLRKFEGHRRGVESIVCLSSSLTIYTSSSDGSIRQWDIVSGTCTAVFEGHQTNVYQLSIIDDLDFWSASADKTVRAWDLQTTKCTQVFEHPDSVRTFIIHDRFLITGCRDEKIRVWDRVDHRVIRELDVHLDEVSSMALLDGRWLVTGSYDASVRCWSIADITKDEVAVKPDDISVRVDAKVKDNLLSAEEERELAKLMGEDD